MTQPCVTLLFLLGLYFHLNMTQQEISLQIIRLRTVQYPYLKTI